LNATTIAFAGRLPAINCACDFRLAALSVN
jgi:hypothetical protein